MVGTFIRNLFRRQAKSPALERLNRFTPRLEGLEGRWVPATLNVGSGQAFATLGAALAAAQANDTIQVFSGTYQETLNIDKNGIKLTEKPGETAIITAPPDTDPSEAIIDVTGIKVKIEGFEIDGSTNGDGDVHAGIRILNGGSATIRNNVIHGLSGANDPAFGIGIQVGASDVTGAAGKGAAWIDWNAVHDYLGAGVLVDGNASSATIKDNTITGSGATATTVQYGVQISRTASGRVEFNDITNNNFGDEFVTSAGVLVFETTAKTVVARNYVENNQTGIYLFTVGNGQVLNNDVVGGDYGISVEEFSFNNLVKGNDVCNAGVDGIGVYDSSNNQIKSNDVHGSGDTGIYLQNADANELFCNDLENNAGNGIYLFASSNNTLWDNETENNGANGILIEEGGHNTITFTASAYNSVDGIHLLNTVCNTIQLSVIANNGDHGIALYNADGTTIRYNIIIGDIFVSADSTDVSIFANYVSEGVLEEEVASGADVATEDWLNSVADADAETAELAT
ncbi:MAG: right-handed parallel beta-helix repeat-containing protein [Gemmataceae bacterium]|nr:right-handed parallel beta-helix repeat-containing protein [Gemmataceae bacterium]